MTDHFTERIHGIGNFNYFNYCGKQIQLIVVYKNANHFDTIEIVDRC